jgi:ketosteroid isomerase-like protein
MISMYAPAPHGQSGARNPCAHAVRCLAIVALSMLLAHPAMAQGGASARRDAAHRADSTSALRSVEAFRGALASGDSTGALTFLSPDVIVLESGDVERHQDYRSHHLAADIAYAKSVPSTHALTGVQVVGDVAWIASTSTSQGQFNGRAVNSAGAELMVLSRARPGAPWRIRAIHWSSRRKAS